MSRCAILTEVKYVCIYFVYSWVKADFKMLTTFFKQYIINTQTKHLFLLEKWDKRRFSCWQRLLNLRIVHTRYISVKCVARLCLTVNQTTFVAIHGRWFTEAFKILRYRSAHVMKFFEVINYLETSKKRYKAGQKL